MSARHILLLAPHPDDEVVGCATAIARARAGGSRVFCLYLTSGVPPVEALWRGQRRSHAGRVARRREEAGAAAAALGVEPIGFSERPSRTLKAELGAALGEIAEAARRCAASELWVSAWEGAHQDHDAANFLASLLLRQMPVFEYAEYNHAGGVVRRQEFPHATTDDVVLRLTPAETAQKRRLLGLYRSEKANLRHIASESECLRPLPPHDYAVPPHAGTLFCERFHWVPFHHPRVDFEPHARLRAALAAFRPGELAC